MSVPIFKSALSRALCRRPLSIHALAGFNGTMLNRAIPHHWHRDAPPRSARCTFGTSFSISAGPPKDPSKSPQETSSAESAPPTKTSRNAADAAMRRRSRRSSTRRTIRLWVRQLGSYPLAFRRPFNRRRHLQLPRSQGAHADSRLYKTLAPRLRSLLGGIAVDIPRYNPGKKDLSYNNPFLSASQRRRRRKIVPQATWRMTRYSLKEITASFIYYSGITGGFRKGSRNLQSLSIGNWRKRRRLRIIKDLQDVFTPRVISYLHRRGFAPEDVMTWAWILTPDNGLRVGWRLSAVVKTSRVDGSLKQGQESNTKLLPPFVILSILQRKYLLRSTLQILFRLIQGLYSPGHSERIVDDKTTLLFAIRLLRHARRTVPAALLQVVDLINNNFYTAASPERPPRWVTHTFNRLLSLFSLPTSDRPYKNVPLLQQCQFALVQKMSAIGAPITREGYRAIISVQLAHHKTPQEAEKVRYMGKNWPPWFTERDGWGATHRLAHQTVLSRGGQVIQQMMEAGYKLMDWEKEAAVLAGRDTDCTPTIQTRSFWNKRRLRKGDAADGGAQIWAARVRATRTIDEAWFHFRQCRAQYGVPHRDVWTEMFEKVIWQEKLAKLIQDWSTTRKSVSANTYYSRPDFWLRKTEEQRRNTVPGDGKELIPPPLNPTAGVYNPESPPGVEDLFSMMVRDGVRPHPRLVALIIREANLSVPFSMAVLRHWDSDQAFQMLYPLYRNLPKNTKPSTKPLNPQILAAFLTRLCKRYQPVKAFKVISHRPLVYRPAWNAVFRGFIAILSPRIRNPSQHPQRLESIRAIWSLYKSMTALLDVDNNTLRYLCVAAERWITLPDADDILWDGLPPPYAVIPVFFDSITAQMGLLPDPAALHAFVRTLGLVRRYAEIERLLMFLAEQNVPLDQDAMGRRVLKASRAFLEGAGYGVFEGDVVVSEIGWAVLERLTPVVQDTWGGWGEEGEIEEYLILAGMVKGRRIAREAEGRGCDKAGF